MTQVLEDRLAKLNELTLLHGSHSSFDDGACGMEIVAWLAGEPHSDAPVCACPVIARAVICLNDRISDDTMRTELLRPLLPRIVGTRAAQAVMVKRGFIAADAAVRVFAPIALEARGRLDLAKSLRECLPIVDVATAENGRSAADAAAAAAARWAAAAAAAADAVDAAGWAAAAAADAAAAAARRMVYEEGARMIERMIEVAP